MNSIKNYLLDNIAVTYRNFQKFQTKEKYYILAQCLWLVCLVISVTLTPLIVKAITGNATLTGAVRAVYLWTLSIFTLSAADIIKKGHIGQVLAISSLCRSFSFGILALFLIGGELTLPLLLSLMFINGVVVSFSYLLDIDTGGVNRIFNDAQKKESVFYIYTLVDYSSLLILPIFLGLLIEGISYYSNMEVALGIGFSLITILLLTATYFYYYYIAEKNKDDSKKETRTFSNIKTYIYSWLSIPKRFLKTSKIIIRNKAISLRFVMIAIEQFIDDALFMVVLPVFALDILNTGVLGNSLILSSMYFGGILSASFMLTQSQKIQKSIGSYSFIFWLGIASSLAFVPTILFWNTTSLWLIIPAVILMKMLFEPLRSRMNSLLQIEISMDKEAKEDEENIFSLLTVVLSFFGGLGGLFFTWLFQNTSEGTFLNQLVGGDVPMKMVTLVFICFSLITLTGIYLIKHHFYHRYFATDEVVEEYSKELVKNLELLNLSTIENEVIHTHSWSNSPTAVLLAPPTLNKLSIALEGGVLSPGNVHLVYDPSWIEQELQPDGTNRLYLTKGLYFDHEGDPILAEYRHKRPIYYFANFCTPGANTKIEGRVFEKKLNIPMSNSSKFEALVKDVLLTRIWLSEKNVPIIKTTAFLFPDHAKIKEIETFWDKNQTITLFPYPYGKDISTQKKYILHAVEDFLKHYEGKYVVIKPSGAKFTPPEGVAFFARDQTQEMVEHIATLSKHSLMTEKGAILIEERLHPPPLYFQIGENDESGHYCFTDKEESFHILTKNEIVNASEETKKDWVLHLLIAKTPWKKGIIAGIIPRIDRWGKPLTRNATKVPFENLTAAIREQYNLLNTDEEIWNFENELEILGDKVLQAILENEKTFEKTPEDPIKSETDFLGLDIMIELKDGVLVPKIISIADQNVGFQYFFDEVYPEKKGEHSKAWIATMLSRARQEMFRGKRILLVGAGDTRKISYFGYGEKKGMHLILVDTPDSWAKDLADEFIPVQGFSNSENIQEALEGINRSIYSHGTIDAIASFGEDIIFTAELARALGLSYHSVEAARNTRQKAKTRKILKSEGLPTPLFFPIHNQHSIEKALSQISRIHRTTGISPFPMMFKPNSGLMSMFVTKINTPEELQDKFLELNNKIKEFDLSETIESKFILEEYISGIEWDVDIVLQNGKVKYYSLTDNWNDGKGSDIEMCDSMPGYRLSKEAGKGSIQLAIDTAKALGLTDGIIHAEGKYDPEKGGQILEISARPAGAYLTNWQEKVWGVDFIELFFATALNIPIQIYKSETPLTHLEGVVIIPNKNGTLMQWEGLEQARQQPGFVRFFQNVEVGTQLKGVKELGTPIGELEVEGTDPQNALNNFIRIRSIIKPIIE